MKRPNKFLAIQFKSLGDTVLLLPTLKAVRTTWPECKIHALVTEAAAPLLQHSPWVDRVWASPRVHGRADFRTTWPILRALRAEQFDRSADFGGNDRGAIASLLIGAKERAGLIHGNGFAGRRFCYTKRIASPPKDWHESRRLWHSIAAWGIAEPCVSEPALTTDPALDIPAARLLPPGAVICHIGAAVPKKQWPLNHWTVFYAKALAARHHLVFNGGISAREQDSLREFRRLLPDAPVLPRLKLPALLAVTKRARAFVSNDTGPMHFAAALGVPTVGLFGPTSSTRWFPMGKGNVALQAPDCTCQRGVRACQRAIPCLAGIAPETVFQRLDSILQRCSPAPGRIAA